MSTTHQTPSKSLAGAPALVFADSNGRETKTQPDFSSDQHNATPLSEGKGYVSEAATLASVIVPVVSSNEREQAPPLPSGQLLAEAVPEAVKPQPIPILRALMPVIMIVAVVAMVGLMVLSGGSLNPMMMIFPLMMGMSMLMMFSPPPSEDTDELRRTYLRHLGSLRQKAVDNAKAQRVHQLFFHPDPRYLWSQVGTHRMWERSSECSDAFAVRVGVGTTELCTPIVVGDPGAAEDLDPVCAVSLRQVVRNVGHVQRVPVVLALSAFPVLSITGRNAAEVARAIVLQLVFHHGPEIVGITALGRDRSWTKWLPHTKEPESAVFRVLLIDETVDVDQALMTGKYSCIIDVGSHRASSLRSWAEYEGLVLHAEEQIGVETEVGVEDIAIPDLITMDEAGTLARAMTKYRRADNNSSASSMDLRKLLGVNEINTEVVRSLWQPRGQRRLSVPIGLTQHSTPIVIDIKESAQGGIGPHGLCVGATGSGKSELLRTLVVALASTHSPEDLNLVLVDFKGGATFLGLDGLPHTSAVITNLEEESILVERMHDAIAGEMTRRQELLRKAGNFANATEYNAARKSDPTMQPLPALFIVVDEFSELLGQHPDFADLFVAVGRLGRSLQIHLLLASQRLEEGRLRGLDSHLSYRIGLKTFSASESRQVLGVPDAYSLPSKPGAGFLKSGSEELTRFRASYVSGPMMVSKQEQVSVAASGGVRLFNGWEDLVVESNVDEVIDPRGFTLVDAVVEAAKEVAGERNLKAHQMWLPPLPKEMPLANVVEPVGKLCAAIGIIDRPYQQRQDPFVVDLSGQNGHVAVCGGPQTGKTTALHSLVLSLCLTHTTHEIRFYVLDMSSSILSGLGNLPHTAGVARKNEDEKVRRLVDEVCGLIDAPEERHTFVIIDGWHVLTKEYEDLADKLSLIASEGLSARVHLLVSTVRWTAIRPAVRDLITTRIELKLGESLDSVVDRKAQQKLPARAGLGLTPAKEYMLIALSSVQDQQHVLNVTGSQDPVPALRLLPHVIGRAEVTAALGASAGRDHIPLGVGGPRLEPVTWDLSHSQHIVIVGSQGSGKTTAVRTIIEGITDLGRDDARIIMVDYRRSHLGAIMQEMLAGYCANTDQAEETISALVNTLKERLPGPDITPQELAERSWWSGPELFLVIEDFDLLPDGVLHALHPLLPHSRDIGLHVVVARKAGGIGRALFQPFLSSLRDQTPHVMLLDADKEEGQIFGIKPVHLQSGRANYSERGTHAGLMHIATPNSLISTNHREA